MLCQQCQVIGCMLTVYLLLIGQFLPNWRHSETFRYIIAKAQFTLVIDSVITFLIKIAHYIPINPITILWEKIQL